MEGFGAHAATRAFEQNPAPRGFLGRRLWQLVNMRELMQAEGKQPLVRDVWLDGIQVMAARSEEGSTEGFYLAAKGGHNNESHNHNDVGNFIVYCDGQPLLIDAGVGVYTAKTFSDKRYDIWTMQSAYHNLPTVNGTMQQPGREFAASDVTYDANDRMSQFSLDISGAYPAEAGIDKWMRNITLRRGHEVSIEDIFTLTKRNGELMMSLLTPCEVTLGSNGTITLQGDTGGQTYSARLHCDNRLTPSVETIELDDRKLSGAWGEKLYRITLRAADDSPLQDKWTLRITR